jgi:uncharacterized protein YlxW (UPF0749 family)
VSNRRGSHRQQRETNTREKRELEQENRQLRREVARLRKQVEQYETASEDEEEVKEEIKPTLKCPDCKGTKLASINTPSGKVRHVCRGCSWRGSI